MQERDFTVVRRHYSDTSASTLRNISLHMNCMELQENLHPHKIASRFHRVAFRMLPERLKEFLRSLARQTPQSTYGTCSNHMVSAMSRHYGYQWMAQPRNNIKYDTLKTGVKYTRDEP